MESHIFNNVLLACFVVTDSGPDVGEKRKNIKMSKMEASADRARFRVHQPCARYIKTPT